jgi:tetratricopeptide (TPR) repeat protein
MSRQNIESSDDPGREGKAPGMGEIERRLLALLEARVGPHWQRMLAAVVVVALVLTLALLLHKRRAERLDMGFYQVSSAQTVDELRALAVDLRGSKPGEQAAFLLARRLYEDAQYADAAVAFSEFLTEYSTSDMLAAARLGSAYALEADARLNEAQEAFVVAADLVEDATSAAEAWLGAGRCAESRGLDKQARQYYENGVAASDSGTFRDQAVIALKRLQVVPAVEESSTLETSVHTE